MAEFLEFLANHWIMSSAFVVVLVLFIANELKQRSGGAKLDGQQVIQLINHQDATVVDIRHVEAFREGHILNAVNVPLSDLDNRLTSLNKYKSKPIVVVCDQGMTASKAAKKLKDNDFENIYILSGGLMAWKADNLPITKKD